MQSPNLILLSNQEALQRSLDVVANNVANSSTTGFKREGIEFNTLLDRVNSDETIKFVGTGNTFRDTSTGPIQPTGNPLDLAIQGEGYFSVRAPDGSLHYTRGGSLHANAEGQIVTQANMPVLSDGGQPITLPDTTTDVNVSGDGFVTARIDNGVNLAQLGKIGLVKFANDQALQPEGNGLYKTSQISAPAQGSIVEGSLEQSNVEPVTEMTQMIKIMRAYEQTTNLISLQDNRQTDAITKLSKTTA